LLSILKGQKSEIVFWPSYDLPDVYLGCTIKFSFCALGEYTVKRVDEVVQHPHLVTQGQFTQVSKKVSDIPEENFTKNIEVFRQTFTNVELLRQMLNVSKLTPPGREPSFPINSPLLYHCATVTLWTMGFKLRILMGRKRDYNVYTVHGSYVNCFRILSFWSRWERSASFLKSMTNAAPHCENMRGFVDT
jgi:hypothetical protein